MCEARQTPGISATFAHLSYISQDSLHKFRDHRSNSDVLQALRKTFESSQSGQAASSIREMTELAAFMKANRLHQVRSRL